MYQQTFWFGPFDLTGESVERFPSAPIVYVLGRRSLPAQRFGFNAAVPCYVGRSTRGQQRLLDHLPGTESNFLLAGCDVFWIHFCADDSDAFLLESAVFHDTRDKLWVNAVHPAKPNESSVECPICRDARERFIRSMRRQVDSVGIFQRLSGPPPAPPLDWLPTKLPDLSGALDSLARRLGYH